MYRCISEEINSLFSLTFNVKYSFVSGKKWFQKFLFLFFFFLVIWIHSLPRFYYISLAKCKRKYFWKKKLIWFWFREMNKRKPKKMLIANNGFENASKLWNEIMKMRCQFCFSVVCVSELRKCIAWEIWYVKVFLFQTKKAFVLSWTTASEPRTEISRFYAWNLIKLKKNQKKIKNLNK